MSEHFSLKDFIRESNRIEGIHRQPTKGEITATEWFLRREALSVGDFQHLVSVYAPGNVLRESEGMNVRVGSYIAPSGGPSIRKRLEGIILDAEARFKTPWEVHVDYERLHPFTDGNGRSGRALWLWMMRTAPLGFLHHFYYQTLERDPRRSVGQTVNDK